MFSQWKAESNVMAAPEPLQSSTATNCRRCKFQRATLCWFFFFVRFSIRTISWQMKRVFFSSRFDHFNQTLTMTTTTTTRNTNKTLKKSFSRSHTISCRFRLTLRNTIFHSSSLQQSFLCMYFPFPAYSPLSVCRQSLRCRQWRWYVRKRCLQSFRNRR